MDLLDREAALERVAGDLALLVEIAALFLQEYPMLLGEIERALAGSNFRDAERAAHSLKGSVANFGAKPVVSAALRVEQAARSADMTGASRGLAELKEAIAAFHPEVAALAAEGK